MHIELNSYSTLAGGNEENFHKYKVSIINVIRKHFTKYDGQLINTVDVYNFKGEYINTINTDNKRIIIFANATLQNNTPIIEKQFQLNNVQFKKILSPKGEGTLITYKNSTIAECINGIIYILIDIFGNEYNEKRVEIFEHIIKTFAETILETILETKLNELSWKKTKNKAKLTKKFIETLNHINETKINEETYQLNNLVNKKNEYRNQLKDICDKIAIKMSTIQHLKNTLYTHDKLIEQEFDNIVNLDKVEDLKIEGEKLFVYTKTMYTYDEKGAKYHTGKFRIEINPFNTSIKFFGDTPRRSYWTDHDPHPHVNGDTGNACLGNVESTIAELCSQKQLYALVTICLDFIESVNTNDAAGINIVNWDRVDANGNIIPAEEMCECDECGEMFPTSEMTRAYYTLVTTENPDFDEDEEDNEDNPQYTINVENEVFVCDNCLIDNYYYNTSVNEYIRK